MKKPDQKTKAEEARARREARRAQHAADVAELPALIEAELAQARRPEKMQQRTPMSRPTVH